MKYLFCLIVITVVSACSLDEKPRDQIPEDKAYNSVKELYMNTVATLYNYIGGVEDGQGLQGTCRGVYDLQTFGSDEAMIPTRGGDWYDGELWQHMYRHSWGAGLEPVGKAWVYLYKVIALCNHSIEQLEKHAEMLDKKHMQNYMAEVRALRAIYYWYLLDLFGNVPLVSSSDIPISQVRQLSRNEMFNYIYSELMEVRHDLPNGNSAFRGEAYGRVTSSVANFVLAKLALNAEVYTDNDWTDGVRPNGTDIRLQIGSDLYNAWEATILFCNDIQAEGFQLEMEYSDNFTVYNEYSLENIWVIPMDKDLYKTEQQNLYRSYHYRHAAIYGFLGENGTCATLNTLRVFGYDTDHQDYRFIRNYWAGKVFDDDDTPVLDRRGDTLAYYPWEVELDLSGSPYVETAGARMRKYAVDRNATKDGKLMDNDIVLFRFADVLLMRAEAYLRNGHAELGQEDFNVVRRRALMQPRPLTLQNIYDERLLELCWEGWRRQDMIRFGQYESLFQGDAFDKKVDESDGHTTVFPIPASAMDLNTHLKQNKGY